VASGQDLSDDVARLYNGWAAAAVRVNRMPPRFLQPGQVLALRLPAGALSGAPEGCTTVAILGARTTSFTARVGGDRPAEGRTRQELRSASGVLTLSRCGGSRPELADLAVGLAGGRATLEVLVAEGPRTAPSLEGLLPDRQPGPGGTLGDVGVTPEVEPLATRVAEMERRLQGSGATLSPRRTLQPQPHGGGVQPLQLSPGCHRLVLLPDAGPGRPADLDAELRDRHDRMLVRDRSNATDALLEVCVGEATPLELAWITSVRGARVTLLQGSWPIPAGVPHAWSPRARAALASAHRKRNTPALTALPVWEAAGLPGRTSIPVEVAPDGCYLAGVTPARGDARSVKLAVKAGASSYFDTGGGGYESAIAAFCASGARVVTLEVEATGQGLHWVGALWKTGRLAPGTPEAW
jgi:hypothetical protein